MPLSYSTAVCQVHTADMDVNEHFKCWLNQYNNILDVVAPVKAYPRRTRKSSFVTDEIRELMNQRAWTVRKLKECHEYIANNTPSTLQELSNSLGLLKRQIKSRIRAQGKAIGEKSLTTNDCKQAWKYIRSATLTGGKLQENGMDANVLNEYFGNLVSDDKRSTLTCRSSCDSFDSFHLSPVTLQPLS